MSDSLYYLMYELLLKQLILVEWSVFGKAEGVNSGKSHQKTKAPILISFLRNNALPTLLKVS